MTSAPAISLANVGVRYGDTVAAQQVSLHIAQGEIHVLLGKSGSGKTTLLRAIAGVEPISSGTITLFGHEVDRANTAGLFTPPEKRRVGVVFQDYALFPHLNVGDNVAFGITRGTKLNSTYWLKRVGLDGYELRPPSQLSGGEQQRVALARALASKPRFMLFDEPFSNLDMTLRRRLRLQTVELLKQEHISAIFVTHDATEAFALGDRLSVMHQSRLLQSGTAKTLYNTPINLDVARSVGETLLFPATRSGELTAKCALGTIPIRAESTSRKTGTVMLRPEQLTVATTSTSMHLNDAHHIGTGAVLKRTFLGATTSILIQLEEHQIEASISSLDANLDDSVDLVMLGDAILL